MAAADFFVRARFGRAWTVLPRFADGDAVSCPDGYLWVRQDGLWVKPEQGDGLAVADATVMAWWRRRMWPGGRRVALVHRLASGELGRIAAASYVGRRIEDIGTPRERIEQHMVTGAGLRRLAAHAAGSRTVSVHLELPSGIVTVHSALVGDVYYHPFRA